MLKPLLKKAIPLLAMIPLLGSCSLFQPQTKVIEYDEEVKLHDGSMIWVHIKRHYGLVGGISAGQGASYMPGAVEISWDTGFPNVGRKSVFFRNVMAINKIEQQWYVIGSSSHNTEDMIGRSYNCNTVGVKVGKIGCMVSVNTNGYVQPEVNKIFKFNEHNIFYPIGIKDWGTVPNPLDKSRVSLQEKIEFEKFQSKANRQLGKPLTKEKSL